MKPMITFFTIPKPFEGHIGLIQRNAIRSWLALGDEVKVVLMGDEPGTLEVAREFGITHRPGVQRSRLGTPLLNGLFSAIEQHDPQQRWFNYINADIVVLDDFLSGWREALGYKRRFLMVGQRVDMDVREPIDFAEADWQSKLRSRAQSHGRSSGPTAIDYFVYRRGSLGALPPFAVGRFSWDNWMIYRARELHLPVIDATRRILAVHQNHDYAHAGGIKRARFGVEARFNLHLAGGQRRLYTIWDATHVLTPEGLEPRINIPGGGGGGIWSYRRSVRLGAA
jgi:hypothetical protein